MGGGFTLRRMGVSFIDYGCELCAGLAMASTVRANDRINL
jgi:hypothetical protein